MPAGQNSTRMRTRIVRLVNVSKAIATACEGRSLAKYPDPFANQFRKQAADVLGVRPDMILCGNGSDDLLTILVRCYVGAGDAMRVPTPSYILYQTLADIQGVLCDKVAFTDKWLLPESFTSPNTVTGEPVRLVVIPNPNSPSGTLLPPEQLLELAEQLPCPLVVDEAYGDFSESNCLDLVEQSDRNHCHTIDEQVLCVGRNPFRVRRRSTCRDRTTRKSKRLIQL